jgi:predicted S18 family serine protease
MNVYFLTFYVPSDQNRLSQLKIQLNALSNGNPQALFQESGVGYASFQAPVMSPIIQNESRGDYISRNVVMKGSMVNISVEIRPGKGRVLIQTIPFTGVMFQGAANTAVTVAGNKTGFDFSKSDVIFSIDSVNDVSEVEGASAGVLMTLLTISAIEKRPIDGSLTMTGTINSNGHIGAIGGVVEKAAAAKDNGKTQFLIPAENQHITPPVSVTTDNGTFTITQKVQHKVSAKDYIEKNIRINVTYVNTIDDVISEALKPL